MAIQVEIDSIQAELLAKHHVSRAFAAIGEQESGWKFKDSADRIGCAMQELAKARAFLVEALKAVVEAKTD